MAIDRQIPDWVTAGRLGNLTALDRAAAPRLRFAPLPLELIVQCPKCKTVETLQFEGNVLAPCRKFRQRDGQVYHDCGSELPCRLHRQSPSLQSRPRVSR